MACGKCRRCGYPQTARFPTETWKSLAIGGGTFPHFQPAPPAFLLLMSRQEKPNSESTLINVISCLDNGVQLTWRALIPYIPARTGCTPLIAYDDFAARGRLMDGSDFGGTDKQV